MHAPQLKMLIMESTALILTFFGVALLLASWVYLLFISFKEDYAWGFMTVFLPPLSYLYSFFCLSKSWQVVGLAALGLALIVAGQA